MRIAWLHGANIATSTEGRASAGDDYGPHVFIVDESWDLLDQGPRAADVLAQQLGIAAGPLAGVLLRLEMSKAVRRLPGNRYARC